MPELQPVEMCANCCRAMARCRCRILPVPVEFQATLQEVPVDG